MKKVTFFKKIIYFSYLFLFFIIKFDYFIKLDIEINLVYLNKNLSKINIFYIFLIIYYF